MFCVVLSTIIFNQTSHYTAVHAAMKILCVRVSAFGI